MEATNEILRKRREGSDLATLIVDRWLLWILVFSASPRRTLSLPGYVPLQRGLRGRKVIRVEFNLIGEPHNNKITIFRGERDLLAAKSIKKHAGEPVEARLKPRVQRGGTSRHVFIFIVLMANIAKPTPPISENNKIIKIPLSGSLANE